MRMAKIQDTDNQILARVWNNRNSHTLLVGMQNGMATLEDSLAASYKIILLPYDPASTLIFIPELKNYVTQKLVHRCL